GDPDPVGVGEVHLLGREQVVDDDHLAGAELEQLLDEVGPDEAGAADYERLSSLDRAAHLTFSSSAFRWVKVSPGGFSWYQATVFGMPSSIGIFGSQPKSSIVRVGSSSSVAASSSGRSRASTP